MIVRIELLSDVIMGSGMSVPGEEDISILLDKDGFPYIKGSTLKGILREEAQNYAVWTGKDENWLEQLFGEEGDGYKAEREKYHITVSDFQLPSTLRNKILKQTLDVTEIFTSLRAFTQLENGIAKDGSLRIARCINQGFVFYGEIECMPEDETIIRELLGYILWIGNMRTRGFGHVSVSALPKEA